MGNISEAEEPGSSLYREFPVVGFLFHYQKGSNSPIYKNIVPRIPALQ